MLLNGNLAGLAMFVIAAVVVAVASLVLRLPDPLVMIGAGATLVALDLGLRLLRNPAAGGGNRFFDRRAGGHLLFAPAWIFGAVVIVVNAVSLAAKKLF